MPPAHQKQEQITKAVEIMQALSHELRFKVCVLLREGERSVTDICESLAMPQHKISQQLAILRAARILRTRKQSRQVFYSLDNDWVLGCVNMALDGQHGVGREANKVQAFEAGRFAEMLKGA